MSDYLTELKTSFETSQRVHDVEEQTTVELPTSAGFRMSTSEKPSSPLLESSSEVNPSSNFTESDQRLSASNESINIRVGSKDAARSFHVSRHLLCTFSEYFMDRYVSETPSPIDLPGDSPVAFEMFVSWLTQQDKPVTYTPNQYSEEPWRSESANAWMLGRKLDATQFQEYALSQFIQNCALSDLSTWELIEEDVPLETPLRRFSEHWITWNFHLAAPGQSEFCTLKTARKSVSVTDSTRDPRIYDLEHWYCVCGDDFVPNCAHDPIAREAALEEANRVRLPLPEWGSDRERGEGGGSNFSNIPSGLSSWTPWAQPVGSSIGSPWLTTNPYRITKSARRNHLSRPSGNSTTPVQPSTKLSNTAPTFTLPTRQSTPSGNSITPRQPSTNINNTAPTSTQPARQSIFSGNIITPRQPTANLNNTSPTSPQPTRQSTPSGNSIIPRQPTSNLINIAPEFTQPTHQSRPTGNSMTQFQPSTNLNNTAPTFTQPARRSKRRRPSSKKIMSCGIIAFLGISFALLVIAATVLCSRLLRLPRSLINGFGIGIGYNGIRYTTITYSIFTCAVGMITVFVPPIFFAYGFFGVPAGVALALDTHSCSLYNINGWGNKFGNRVGDQFLSGYGSFSKPCPYQEMVALTVIVWTSLVAVTIYWVAIVVVMD